MSKKDILSPPKSRRHAASRAQIVKLMKDRVARTSFEISQVIGVNRKTARDLLVSLVAADEVHLTGEYGAYHAALYKFGPTPAGMTKLTRSRTKPRGEARRRAMAEAQSEEELDRILDEAYRSPARPWPHADAVVTQAMSSMVRAGRGAA